MKTTALPFPLLSKSKETISLSGEEGTPRSSGDTHARAHTRLLSRLAQPLGRVPLATAYIQKPLDLPDKILGLLQVIGAHQLPFQDGQGHLWAGSEVKACDWRQRDGGAGAVLHTLKLHHFHGRDRLWRGENTNTNHLVRKAGVPSIPWLDPSVRWSQFPPSFRNS